MQKIMGLVVAFGVATLFGSAALASGDCSYHKTQAAVEKTDTAKEAAAAPEKTTEVQIKTAQVDQTVKAASEAKK